MMRLFVALEPEPGVRQALADLQGRLRALGVTGRYLSPVHLHLTLAFIGMWPEDISGLLPPVRQPFSIALNGLGVFPEAKVLWAGVQPSQALSGLADHVRDALSAAGIPYDRKPFFPHMTLVRKPVLPERFQLEEVPIPPAVMTVRSVCLYRSEHTENGMAYTVIGRGMASGDIMVQ